MSGVSLIVPMAGEGTRFSNIGIKTPKPLISLGGVALFELVLWNLRSTMLSKIVLITRQEHNLKSREIDLSLKLGTQVEIIEVSETTEGPASSVLIGLESVDLAEPVVVANSDQFVAFDYQPFYEALLAKNSPGTLLTLKDTDPKWSFIETDAQGNFKAIHEKRPISDIATVGIYGFSTGTILRHSIKSMMTSDDRTNGEFYVGPAYNFVGEDRGIVSWTDVGPPGEHFFGLGTPADLLKSLSSTDFLESINQASDFWK